MATASVTSKRCTVCTHPERLTIDHLLATGAEFRATGRRFGLSKDAIGRHWAGHVSDAFKASVKMGPYGSRVDLEKLCLEEGKSVVEALRALYSGLVAMLVATRETGSTTAYLATHREARATLNDLARLSGELLPHVTNLSVTQNINVVGFLASLGEDLAAEFMDMPPAMEKLHRVLQRRMKDTALPEITDRAA
jgi:hypothetical protein